MAPRPPCYISVSRRTDIPCFFYKEFFDAWQKGEIIYTGWFGKQYSVSLRTKDVLGYIFWSKNVAPFIAHPAFSELIATQNVLFHFTINNAPQLEPNVAPLGQRIATLHQLCERIGADRVLWRYDPVVKYVTEDGTIATTESGFYELLPRIRESGITRCYFSFMSMYRKTRFRDVDFKHFTPKEMDGIAERMATAAQREGITLYNCCNPRIPEQIPSIQPASCIDDSLLAQTDRFDRHRPLKYAPTRQGCHCYESRDIGSYTYTCPHACRYCYAHPRI